MAARKPLELLREFLGKHECLGALSLLEANVAALQTLLTLKSVRSFMRNPQQAVLAQEESSNPNRKPSPNSRG